MKETNLLSLKNISKSFAGVKALTDASIDFKQGEVHALVGANGAGKSTLIKIISGAITPDEGCIVFDGATYSSMTPQLSSKLGIEVIYQEFNLVSTLSVAENIFLGKKIDGRKLVNFKLMQSKAEQILQIFGLDIRATEILKNLSVAHKQIVEIVKALSNDLKLLVLDEPTAPLSSKEVEVLFKIIRSLKEQGISIIYISHRLEEVFEFSDTITVLRDGEKVITLKAANTNRKELIRYMIDSDLSEEHPREGAREDTVLLDVQNLSGKGFKDISFQLHKGEILGITGLVGSKRTEIVRAIFGADPLESGKIFYKEEEVQIKSPYHAISLGIALVPEDRKVQGIILNLSIRWNLTVSILKKLSKFLMVDTEKEREIVDQYKNVLQIKMSDVDQLASSLSGGNQQKLVLSKWLASDPKLIIFDEPTRGIDVGTRKEIYTLINKLADSGIGVILISSEIDEMIGLSDRMIVLSAGKITGRLEKDQFNKQLILDLESGGK